MLIGSYRLSPVQAHGGGTPRLQNAGLGVYWVTAWTQPEPIRAGQVHVTLALSEPPPPESSRQEAGPPVLNVPLELQFHSLDQPGEVVTAQATHEQAVNKFFYEADLILPQAGRWQVIVQAENPDGSMASVSFEVEALAPPLIDARWLLAGGIVIFFLVGWWITRSMTPTAQSQTS
jgi:hypothetical protein